MNKEESLKFTYSKNSLGSEGTILLCTSWKELYLKEYTVLLKRKSRVHYAILKVTQEQIPSKSQVFYSQHLSPVLQMLNVATTWGTVNINSS